MAAVVGDRGTTSRAAQPPQRPRGPMMKLSLAAYSFNRLLARNWDPQDPPKDRMILDDFVRFCARMKLPGCELTAYYFPRVVTPQYVARLKRLTFLAGLDISGTAIGNDYCVADEQAWMRQITMTREWIDRAAALGAPVIRIFAGRVPKGDTEQAARNRCVKAINTVLPYAAQKGVFLALENHGGITATSDQMLEIIRQVDDSPFFGVNFDSGNFRTADPYADLERIAPYAINAQIKVSVAPEGKGKQPADLERVIGILSRAGYRGYVVLEYEEQDPEREIPMYLRRLRELIG
ncbi:MAG: sugar phosphate isomerase/epimerase [Planctomycetota bacterium]|nr:MAG: sugar phosphate isomerase/epimerase [Planctomycetota bacterium]